MSDPRSFTALRVCALGAVAVAPNAITVKRKIVRFMEQPFMGRCVSSHCGFFGISGRSATGVKGLQGVDGMIAATHDPRSCGILLPVRVTATQA
jgi:hypothetical protein